MNKSRSKKITKRKISRPSYWMPRETDIVDYHSIIGGPITSKWHTVLSVGELPSGEPVAWITDKSGCVSVDSLSPSPPQFRHPDQVDQVDGDPDGAGEEGKKIYNIKKDEWQSKEEFSGDDKGTMNNPKEKKYAGPFRRCPSCGWIENYRCENRHERLGRCLRHEGHTGLHFFASMITKTEDPTFYEALQDPFSVIYFPCGLSGRYPEKVEEQ